MILDDLKMFHVFFFCVLHDLVIYVGLQLCSVTFIYLQMLGQSSSGLAHVSYFLCTLGEKLYLKSSIAQKIHYFQCFCIRCGHMEVPFSPHEVIDTFPWFVYGTACVWVLICGDDQWIFQAHVCTLCVA